MNQTRWTSYEDVARYLLNQMAQEFGLQWVEQKQTIKGLHSGTAWEIDAKGVLDDNEAFVIVECRRYPKARQKQAQVAALAWTIKDTGACGGIVVSPRGFQEGAAKVAAAADIQNVTLSEDSTAYDYMLTFLNKVFIGRSANLPFTGDLATKLIRASEEPSDK